MRLGYSILPDAIARLTERGFEITRQATVSSRFRHLAKLGLYPPHEERTQTGLSLLGHRGTLISSHEFPARVYGTFDDVPAPVRETLVFLENRELLEDGARYRNPAIDWPRFVAAAANFAGAKVLGGGDRFGASTLATQLEKLRHSPDGITRTASDKARQMASATLRSYRYGSLTTQARRQILLDYLNALPIGAMPGYGEVIGLREGMRVWFGIDPVEADSLLSLDHVAPGAGRAYRAVVMLLLAQRRPTHYLQTEDGRPALSEMANSHLRLARAAGIVPRGLADAALNTHLSVRTDPPRQPPMSFVERKAINAARTHIADLVGAPGLYELDRYDLTAVTTIDSAAQRAATRILRRLADTSFLRSARLTADRLLASGDPRAVAYSFVLYERTPEGNALRVQVDNLERPFDLNLGARLELGSTAKLRTLVNYLQIVADLHATLSDTTLPGSAPDRVANDPITGWVREYLRTAPQATVAELLDAALKRQYSASPAETFFTGGGAHVFGNFDPVYDNRTMSVLEGFRHSVNLVFVRLMRDVVRYFEHRLPWWSPGLLDDPSHPGRRTLLERYAHAEGRAATARAGRRHAGLAGDSSIALLAGPNATANRFGRVLRAVDPTISDSALKRAIERRFPGDSVGGARLSALARAVPGSLTLGDRAYVTSLDPLELWVVRQLRYWPSATVAELRDAGAKARLEAYAWLFRNTSAVRRAQDRAIRVMLERDAFVRVHQAWSRVGYPYDNMVPSLGSAVGSSGDRPGALAELIGIIIGDGIRRPTMHVDELRFGEGMPYEVVLRRKPVAGERVLTAEVAAAVRYALLDVVENGTASQLHGALPAPELAIGGKTGTGDNVVRTASGPRTTNRTATFVFAIGDRYFGAATAYVDGPSAGNYNFTSALPVRVVRLLLPNLESVIAVPAVTAGPVEWRASHQPGWLRTD